MSFRTKTILGIALIESILLLILVFRGLSFLTESNEQQLINRAETLSQLFAAATKDAVLATDLATLESFVFNTASNPEIGYARITANNVVLAEYGEANLLAKPFSPDSRLADIDDGSFDVRAEITEGGIQFGTIEIGLKTQSIQEIVNQAGRWASGLAALEIVLVALFSFILGTYLTRQLTELKRASQTIADSGPGHQIRVKGNDELADVAKAFNSMSVKLADNYRKLQRSLTTQQDAAAMTTGILATSLDAIITIDAEGKILHYNPGAESIFGWKKEEVLNRPMVDFIIPPVFREAHRAGMKRLLSTGSASVLDQRLELMAQHQQGHEFPIEIAISQIDTEQGPMFTAFIRDISERKAAETELRLSARAFETSEAMLITDANARIIRVNKAFTDVTGYSSEEAIGKKPGELLGSERTDKSFYIELWQHLNQFGEWRGEIYNRRKNGEIFPEYLHISAVKDTEDHVSHYIGHFVDITEQKQHEERLAQAKLEAETATEAKSRFLAAMSHEIRTPMNAVLGILGLLKETQLNERQRELIKTGRASGEHLLSLINDILDFSKMEANKLNLEHVGFDLHQLAQTTIELLRPMAEQKGLALSLDIEANTPQLATGDPDRLRQILINLINNAIKFTATGKVSVKLSAQYTEAGNLRLYCAVSDTGIGIAEEHLETLFDEFTMADASEARSHQGTGLGLAICQNLIRLMAGDIKVSSQLGKGTTFRFNAELAPCDKLERNYQPLSPVALPNRAIRILLAEDNSANQMVLRAMLEQDGVSVDIVANGIEAVESVKTRPYDLILMDVSMPEMDGIEATQKIRLLANGAIPILALTAHAIPGDRQRFFDAGMDDCLNKPIDKQSLNAAIAHWLSQHQVNNSLQPITSDNSQSDCGETSLVDKGVISQLERDTSPEIAMELLTFYIEDAKGHIENITKAWRNEDKRQLEFVCHTLGSSAAAHGNMRLHKLAREIEHLCQQELFEAALGKVEALVECSQESFQQLERFIALNVKDNEESL